MSFELLAVIVLSIILGVVLFSYERAIGELLKLKRERNEEERASRLYALRLVKDAREKAIEIIGEAKVDTTKWREILDEEIMKLTDEQLIEYKEKLQTISKDIEKDVKIGAEDFRKVLEMETVGAEKAVARRVQDEFGVIEKQIQEYKLEKMNEIKSTAEVLLDQVVRDVFGKGLAIKDHEQLIIRSLDRAKGTNAI